MIRVLAFAAVLSASPAIVFAQTAQEAPAATAPATQGAQSADEAAFEARAEAFGQTMQAMAGEMSAAITAAGGDAAKQDADLDAIEARYQADVDAFAADLTAFVERQAALAPEEERAGMTAGVAAALPEIRGIPAMVRSQVEAAAVGVAAPEPTTPPAS